MTIEPFFFSIAIPQCLPDAGFLTFVSVFIGVSVLIYFHLMQLFGVCSGVWCLMLGLDCSWKYLVISALIKRSASLLNLITE